jgi:uncharacterized protein involved in exopolysaccharide biosynthesis
VHQFAKNVPRFSLEQRTTNNEQRTTNNEQQTTNNKQRTTNNEQRKNMNEQNPNDEISLKELIEKGKEWYSYLLAQSKTILLAGIIGAALGLTYSFIKKPVYTATLTFALEDDSAAGGGLGGALGLASSLGFDLGGSGGGAFSGENLAELFKSRSMVEKTLMSSVVVENDTISLAEMYIRNEEWRESWQNERKLNGIQFTPNIETNFFNREQDSIIGVIYKDFFDKNLVVAQKDKKVSIISIDVKSTDELFAKYFSETLAKEVSDFYIDTKSKKSRLNMSILQRQTDSIRHELNSAITGVAIATDNTFMLNPALNVKRTASAKRQVDVQANTAILTELVKQTELAKVTLRKDTPLIQIIDRPILPLENNKLGKVKGSLAGGFLAGLLIVILLIGKQVLDEQT